MSNAFIPLVNYYLTQCEAEGNSPVTLATKRYALEGFILDCPEDPAELAPHHVFAWVARCRARGMRDGGIASYEGTLWHFFRWLHDNGFTPVDLSRKVKRIRPKDSEVRRPTVTAEDVRRMLVVAEHQREHPYRNHALISVLYDTGIRRAELAMVDLADVDMDGGTLFVRHGKGGKQRLIGLGTNARTSLWRYFVKERTLDPGPLFIARKGVRLSSGGIRDVLRHVSELAAPGVTSHQFRRGATNRLLGQGGPLGDVMSQLGHESPTMTLLYGRAERQERAIATFHALDQGVRKMR